jgi:hypothetical protein
MMEIIDTAPVVNVQASEYRRLLGYPREYEPGDRVRELMDWATEWYGRHGRPWFYAREAQVGPALPSADAMQVEGVIFESAALQSRFEKCHAAFLAAVSAGPELEEEACRLWEEGKPDEYFFLEILGSAVVEHLTHVAGARLCALAEQSQMAVLPHYSPGYPEWHIGDQNKLLRLFGVALPASLEALSSGALRPKKSQLALFGITRHTESVRRPATPCENCSYAPCEYRRPRVPAYSVKVKALKRWAEDRLTFETRMDGTIEALFRYEGTTCSNMGRPLEFHYRVALGPREDGYPIREQVCAPAPGDSGHRHMCGYIEKPVRIMEAIAQEKPLLGQPLASVLEWRRTGVAPGCYCESTSREHKWGLVLETIHYALTRQENHL